MWKWVRRIGISVLAIVAAFVAIAPWALYWSILNNVEGRPKHAISQTFTAEDETALQAHLRMPEPYQGGSLTPHSLIWGQLLWPMLQEALYEFVDRDGHLSINIAIRQNNSRFWAVPGPIARDYLIQFNRTHQRLDWHPSNAALTIWLTRNWTRTQLIAKAIELDREAEQVQLQRLQNKFRNAPLP
jgi:hypothetical protein